MSQSDSIGEVARQFAVLNVRVQAEGDASQALQRLVDLAVDIVPGSGHAAVTVWSSHRPPRQLAISNGAPTLIDELQHEFGAGPSLTAAAGADSVRISDLACDFQFPELSVAVRSRTPVRGLLAFRLLDEPDRTVLSLYADQANAFDDNAFNIATTFVAHTRALLSDVVKASRAAGLEMATSGRRVIGIAIGVLMTAHHIDADQALNRLRASSDRLRRTLRDVAEEVVRTRHQPGADTASS